MSKRTTDSSVARNAPFGNDFTVHVNKIAGCRRHFSVTSRANDSRWRIEQSNRTAKTAKTATDMQSANIGVRSVPADPFEGLYRESICLNNDEQKKLVMDLARRIHPVPEKKLHLLHDELMDHDPMARGYVESALFGHLLAERLKPVILQTDVVQKLIVLFALNPRKPRQVNYSRLVKYLTNVLRIANSSDEIKKNGNNCSIYAQKMTNHHGPYTRKGDELLIREIQAALQNAQLAAHCMSKLRTNVLSLTKKSSGFLTEKQIIDLLKPNDLLSALQSILPRLLARCELNADLRYNSETFLMFLETASGQVTNGFAEDIERPPSPSEKPSTAAANENIRMKQRQIYVNCKQDTDDRCSLGQCGEATARADHQAKEAATRTVQLLTEALGRLDSRCTNLLPVAKARIVIQQFNDLHRLGLQSKLVNRMLAKSADDSQRYVRLSELCQELMRYTPQR